MKISIIIPTYNRRELLLEGLRYLATQQIASGNNLEVVIADDGSNDGTLASIEDYKKEFPFPIRYSFRARDSASCRSRARNIGISQSSGDILVFMDSGVLVAPSFIRYIEQIFGEGANNQVVLHRVLGLDFDGEIDREEELNGLNPANLELKLQAISNREGWGDRRENLFCSVNDQLYLLPAPWAVGWTCLLTVSRELIELSGTFDETFLGWGAEDVDFSYRLHKFGGRFISHTNAMGVHYPHSRGEDTLRKHETDRGNKWKFHQKHYTLETEVFWGCAKLYFNQIVCRFHRMVLCDLIPVYSHEMCTMHLSTFMQDFSRTLIVGYDDIPSLRLWNSSHIFVVNPTMAAKLQATFPTRDVQARLGYSTPYSDAFFELTMVTDFIRTLGERFFKGIVKELLRISEKVVLILSEDYVPIPKERDGAGQWMSNEEIKKILEDLGLRSENAGGVRGVNFHFVEQMKQGSDASEYVAAQN